MKDWRALLFALVFAPLAMTSAVELPASIREVHAPVFVGRPPSDAVCGLVRLENGDIRHYDYGDQPTPAIHRHPDLLPTSYMVSHNEGLAWETQPVPQGHFGADTRSPVSGEYLRLLTKTDGVYVVKSKGGMDGAWTLRRVWETPITTEILNLTRSVVFVRGGKRALVPWCTMRCFAPDHRNQVGTLYSDDDGETWRPSNLIEAPAHQPNERDQSVRWQNGAYEPTLIELRDGRVWMLMRTSQDFHYQSFSSDGGATWSQPEPSPFYGTITDPTIGRLKDGRLLFLWNNTTPLPEFPKNEFTAPFITQSASDGTGEDMFTNRDALHAATSADEGKTWRGFREVLLNPRRNDANYAETGGIDRSVHQAQFVEVAAGRVVVAVGQHWLHRALVIFDPAWLLETVRWSDFSKGLADWSVQGYKKGIRGHCALNRFESSTLITHPDDAQRRVLQVCNTGRPDAIFPRGGATWNFPAGRAGVVETRIRLSSDFGGVRICLLDRWLNPTDPTVSLLAMCHLDIAADGNGTVGGKLSPGQWHTLSFAWKSIDLGALCELTLDGQPAGTLSLQRRALHGLSYVHFQSTAAQADHGLLVESVRAEVTPPGTAGIRKSE